MRYGNIYAIWVYIEDILVDKDATWVDIYAIW